MTILMLYQLLLGSALKLTPDRVKRLVVIVMYDCGMNTGEMCGLGTLAELQNEAVEKYGSAGFQCYEVCGDPSDEQQVSSLADRALEKNREVRVSG